MRCPLAIYGHFAVSPILECMAATATTFRTVSPLRDPAVYRQIQDAMGGVRALGFREIESMTQAITAPLRDTSSPVFEAHERLLAAFSPMHALFDQLIEARRQLGQWWASANPFQPTSINGLEDQLAGLKRRSIEAEVATHVHLRALLAARSQQGDAPGRTVTARPQVTRGPNNTRRSIESNPPAGLLRV